MENNLAEHLPQVMIRLRLLFLIQVAHHFSPLESCGLSEGHLQALKRPPPPGADLVVHTADIPRRLYPPPLLVHQKKISGGYIGNTNEEGVTVQEIAYFVEDSELRDGFKFFSRGNVGANIEGGGGGVVVTRPRKKCW